MRLDRAGQQRLGQDGLRGGDHVLLLLDLSLHGQQLGLDLWGLVLHQRLSHHCTHTHTQGLQLEGKSYQHIQTGSLGLGSASAPNAPLHAHTQSSVERYMNRVQSRMTSLWVNWPMP